MSSVDIGLGSTIIRRAQLSPNRRAITFEGETWTYARFGERIRRLAAALRAGGICRGDRVGFLGLNHPAFLQSMYASSCLGAVFVPLNFRLTGPELEYIIGDAGIHTLIVDDALAPLIDAHRNKLRCRRYISSEAARERWDHLAELEDAHEPVSASEPVHADDVAIIMYTSGTTGRPKGAMLSHGNLHWNTVNAFYMETFTVRVSLTCAPLFHIGGLNVTTLQSLSGGHEVVLHRQFDPGLALKDIARYRVNSMFGAPAMFLFMSQHQEFADTDLSSVQILICGGAPVPVALIETYAARGISFCQGYGLTETAPFATLLTSDLVTEKLGSAGQAPLFTQVCIMGDDGEPLAAAEKGEVCVRGPNVMRGYWNRPEATAEAIDGKNWFHTGDIGYLDDEGFLYICDRVKDMVISGGENVYPAEVEGVIYEHPAIAEVAVIGLPDEKWGEAVTAVVVLHAGQALTLEDLRDFAAAKLARYKLPLRLHTVEGLPRNPAGKVLKFELREKFAG